MQGFLQKAQRERQQGVLLPDPGSTGCSRDTQAPCGTAAPPERGLPETVSRVEEVEVKEKSVTVVEEFKEVEEKSVTVVEEEVNEKSVKWMYEEVEEEEAQEKQGGREIYTLDIPDFLLPDGPEGGAGEPFVPLT